ncbi:hypothetical protein B7R22_14450 [Subtercola boreus]|uniref:Uncharacterized protein n=1 Tax=Subtercola boreus TaxID=120213 RepID=A0A3E0VTX8_9MICO|nr:hypothetical protein [Subtercola boreus]RFA12848.1 hypothetical protein B7R22_14450 [Subtercola boreus]
MTPTDETERGGWLRARLGRWGTVGGVAGTGFEAYLRVLHPVPVDTDGDIDGTDASGAAARSADWTWRQVASRTGGTVHPLVQWTALTDPLPDSSGGSGELRVDGPDGSVRLSPPPTGRLAPRLLAALVPALAAATTAADRITVGVWNGWGIPDLDVGATLALPGRDYVLRAGSLGELADPDWPWRAGIAWREPFEGPMPQLIWPADHAWLVASEIDWDSTIVAGPRTLVDALLTLPVIESLEVGESYSLMSGSDQLNPGARLGEGQDG